MYENNSIITINNLCKSDFTLILGSGIHYVQNECSNVLNNWSLLLDRISDNLKLQRQNHLNHSLTLRFEKLIEDYSLTHSMPAHKAEDQLKKAIAKEINSFSHSQDKKSLIELISKFSASQILSLNVDSLVVNNKKNITTATSIESIPLDTKGFSNDIPVYFINGNIQKSRYLNFGMQSIAKQIKVLSKSFNHFKKYENDQLKQNELIEKSNNWIARFFYKPVLIVGASIGEHELALRYILNQRKRNFAFKKKYETPVYIVLDECSSKNKCYLSELDAIGVKPIVFHRYSEFWKLISNMH